MFVRRICKRAHPDLTGEGAKQYGGRWNSPGRAMVYTASCGALAALEYRVHLGRFAPSLLLLKIEIPDILKHEKNYLMPGDPKGFLQIGDEWLQDNKTAVLEVDSVLVPKQKNYLLNPAHHQFDAIQIVEQMPFVFDTRLLSGTSAPSAF